MEQFDYLTLHNDDFKIIGHPLNAVSLIEVNEDAVQRRENALLQGRISASKKAGRI